MVEEDVLHPTCGGALPQGKPRYQARQVERAMDSSAERRRLTAQFADTRPGRRHRSRQQGHCRTGSETAGRMEKRWRVREVWMPR